MIVAFEDVVGVEAGLDLADDGELFEFVDG